VGISYFSSSVPWRRDQDSPLRVSTTFWPASLRTTSDACISPGRRAWRGFRFLDGAGGRAPMWKVRIVKLRARLADALGPDDAYGHALLDQRAGREIHAVAHAHTPREASQVSGLRTGSAPGQFFDLPADAGGNQLVSRTMISSVIGFTMLARLTRPLTDSARLTSTFSRGR